MKYLVHGFMMSAAMALVFALTSQTAHARATSNHGSVSDNSPILYAAPTVGPDASSAPCPYKAKVGLQANTNPPETASSYHKTSKRRNL